MTLEEKAEEYARRTKKVDWEGFPIDKEARKEGYIAGATENGIVWHDLRKNPRDLPNTDRDVIVKRESEDESEIDNYYNDDEWVGWGKAYREQQYYIRKGDKLIDDVVAWCEMPRFEE